MRAKLGFLGELRTIFNSASEEVLGCLNKGYFALLEVAKGLEDPNRKADIKHTFVVRKHHTNVLRASACFMLGGESPLSFVVFYLELTILRSWYEMKPYIAVVMKLVCMK